MGRYFVSLVIVCCSVTSVFAAGNFTVGARMGGNLFTNSSNDKLGFGGDAVFAYGINRSLTLTLSAGYRVFPKMKESSGSERIFDLKTIPILGGLRYSFRQTGLMPYVSGEFGGYFDLTDYNKESSQNVSDVSETTVAKVGHSKFETIVGLGFGVASPIAPNLLLDINATIFHPNSFSEHVGLMVGLCWQL